ncbi:MAG: oligopeptide:H+ symporter [Gammaproteobacteria bacterium]|nr:oligopeptide:H+ symporter [Gammaproteobacteria bacterium]
MLRFDLKQRQSNTVAMITFWSQFAVYTINTVFILYLTRPIWKYGLGYSETKAYAFMGVTQAMGYLMPMLGGYMADHVLGIRRSILYGTVLLAVAYLFVMLSNFTVTQHGDFWFIAAYALVPVTNSLLMGTSSALVSRIFCDDPARSKAGMTIYYMSINVGGLLAAILAPQLMETHYGPLTIFAIVFAGKALAALNFIWRYELFDNVIDSLDRKSMSKKQYTKLFSYLIVIYVATTLLYYFPYGSSYVLAISCALGIFWFLLRTLNLPAKSRFKQFIAIALIVEAIIFFIVYNQMNTTLILFAANNSDLNFFGLKVAPANYQMVNPLTIILLSLLLPSFYKKFHGFKIPYQFAAGVALAGVGLLVMWFACLYATHGLINGNYLVLSYFIITISELWVSAIGLSMIGLYCEEHLLSFAMGAWYLAVSLSNVLSGRLAAFVALPEKGIGVLQSLHIYQSYYLSMGLVTLLIGMLMGLIAVPMLRWARSHEVALQ